MILRLFDLTEFIVWNIKYDILEKYHFLTKAVILSELNTLEFQWGKSICVFYYYNIVFIIPISLGVHLYDTETIWFNRIHSLKYQRPVTWGITCDITF